MKKDNYKDTPLKVPNLLVLFIPVSSFASSNQVEVKVANSLSGVDIFLNIIHWGLMLIILLGIVLMPLAGFAWYRKNRANHIWVEYFKSGNFALRATIVIVALILWYFKIIDHITFLIWKNMS